MTDEKVLHIQTVTLSFAAEDDAIENLDNLNERIRLFITEDIVTENERTKAFDGVVLVADSKHTDLVGTLEEWQRLTDELMESDEESVMGDDGLKIPLPKTEKGYLN